MNINWIVETRFDGERLDTFLSRHNSQYSRSQLGAMVRQGKIEVNGKPKKPSYKVKEHDVITGCLTCDRDETKPLPQNIEFNIVYEDDEILVINKPAGLVVHPAVGNFDNTLVNGLLQRYPSIIEVGDDNVRPGIVHRLDKDTTGVMVVALTESAFRFLKKEFMNHRVKKRYLAYASGNLKDQSGEIVLPIGRHPVQRKMMSTHSPNGRYAETHWQVRERLNGVDFVEILLKTGRTHQIRVHFKALGHPLVGDRVYGHGKRTGAGGKRNARKGSHRQCMERTAQRQMLHAWQLSFRHPWSGKRVHFTAPLPDDMAKYVDFPNGNG